MSGALLALSPGLQPRAARARGFSLLEVLVAMVILTVGATGLIALFAAAAATHRRAVDRVHAALVAEEVLAEVQARYLPGAELETIESSLQADLPASIDGYTWSVSLVRPGEEGVKRKPGSKGLSKVTAAGAQKTSQLKKPPGKTQARSEKKSPGAAEAEAKEPPRWSEEEVLVRVVVGWAQAGRLMSETFDTILLPRPVPAASRTPRR